jgi:hypothetical protein
MKTHLLFAFAFVACTGKAPSADTTPPGNSAGPLVLSCCGDNDALIMAQMRMYETTPEAHRSPEVAVFPYRMNSGITRRDRIIVRDGAAWNALWPELLGSHSPVPVAPAADFSRETIVVASMGQRSSGGYSVTIDSAGVAGDTVVLAVTERSPGRTCGTTAALSSPIALARVMRPRAVIRFVEKTVVTDCG